MDYQNLMDGFITLSDVMSYDKCMYVSGISRVSGAGEVIEVKL